MPKKPAPCFFSLATVLSEVLRSRLTRECRDSFSACLKQHILISDKTSVDVRSKVQKSLTWIRLLTGSDVVGPHLKSDLLWPGNRSFLSDQVPQPVIHRHVMFQRFCLFTMKTAEVLQDKYGSFLLRPTTLLLGTTLFFFFTLVHVFV